MAERWRRLRGRLGLPLEAVLCLALARLACLFLPFQRTLTLLGLRLCPRDTARPLSPAPNPRARAVGLMVTHMAKRMPFRAVCLQQSLAAVLMLKRRGLPVDVCLGVARDAGGALVAHAWSQCEGHPVTGESEDGTYQLIAVLRSPG